MRISVRKASRWMALKRRASRREAARRKVSPDRLSELPDSLILQILSFLEMRQVVRTLLSKRWKDLWTRKLSLLYCDLEIGEDVQWNKLESLAIDFASVYPGIEHVVNHIILRRAPRLESLNLRLMEGGEDLNIQSGCLKTFKIARRPDCRRIPGADGAMLRIEAPNLEELKFSEVPYTRCLLKVQTVTCASLWFDGFYNRAYDEPHRMILVKEMLSQVLPIVNHVEKVTLSDWCSKIWLYSFQMPEFLKLHASTPDQILGVLEMFPKLMNLSLKHKDLRRFVVPRSFKPNLSKIDTEPETILASPSLLHLRKVVINWLLHDFGTVIPFVKIVFKDALFLEKMVLRPRSFWGNERWYSLVEKKLLSMPF